MFVTKIFQINLVHISCDYGAFEGYYRYDGFLFKRNRLYILACSIIESLVTEVHEGGLMGYFYKHKTLEILNEHFY